jgi:PhnB protein
MYVPPGFSTVTPYFLVKDAERFISFLAEAFGGVEELRSVHPDGRIGHVQVRIGDATIMASEACERYPAMPASCYLYVEDADKVMAQSLAAGATLEMEVDDRPYGDRQGGVKDPHGNIWWVSQRLVEAPYSV